MSKSRARRQNRLSGRALDDLSQQELAIRSRAYGASFGVIADELGYRSRSGAENAVKRGLEASGLIVGLRVVMHRRIERLTAQLRVLDPPALYRDAHRPCTAFDRAELMKALLRDAPGCGPLQTCVRDVAGLVARRHPHLPAVEVHEYEDRFSSRRSGATLDMMRGGYANRSGIHKALERDVRRVLLRASAAYFAEELGRIRDLWHDIDLALRRQPVVDVHAMRVLLDELYELLDEMHVFDVMLTYGHLAGRRVRKVSSGLAYPVGDTTVAKAQVQPPNAVPRLNRVSRPDRPVHSIAAQRPDGGRTGTELTPERTGEAIMWEAFKTAASDNAARRHRPHPRDSILADP
jgi:hypothetical protein